GYFMYVVEQERRFNAGPGIDGKNELFTVGARVAGATSGFDYEAEAAYQFGEAFSSPGGDVEYDAFGVNAELGYTFDNQYAPRVFIGGAYFTGPDFTDTDAELGFNRLFSDWEYSEF